MHLPTLTIIIVSAGINLSRSSKDHRESITCEIIGLVGAHTVGYRQKLD